MTNMLIEKELMRNGEFHIRMKKSVKEIGFSFDPRNAGSQAIELI
jgi:hypothetical protein